MILKNFIRTFLLLAISIMIFACNNQETKEEEQQHEVVTDTTLKSSAQDTLVAYQCPMKCEGEKTYSEQGKCPLCEMELVKVE
jgi:hypothetical protein